MLGSESGRRDHSGLVAGYESEVWSQRCSYTESHSPRRRGRYRYATTGTSDRYLFGDDGCAEGVLVRRIGVILAEMGRLFHA